jgi:transcriptional regulator with XRE-family HTH domain
MKQQFGPLLREWRRARRKSQLALALDANVSPRHLGFIEIGRSHPSREMVLTLATALEVPLRERNDLLNAAGFAPMYHDIGWDESQLAHIRRALQRMLTKQEPYPAVVMDRYWNVSMMNEAGRRFFALFLHAESIDGPPNVLRLMFDPSMLRPFVSNWEEVAEGLIQRMHRESVGGMDADAKVRELLAELMAYPDVPRKWATPDLGRAAVPVIPVSFRKGDLQLSFFSTVTTLGTPQDIRLQEMRIECFFPADEETEKLAEQLLSSDVIPSAPDDESPARRTAL